MNTSIIDLVLYFKLDSKFLYSMCSFYW